MNEHARWRLDFARELGAQLRRYDGIKAMAVGGSVARGYSDIYSDIELVMFWEQAPDKELQREIIAGFQAEYRYPEVDPGHDHSVLIRGVPVDLWHLTISTEEATMDSVLRDYSLDLVASNRLDIIQTCIPLYGEALIQGWKDRVKDYPGELAVNYLNTYLPDFHMRQLELAVRRDNPSAYFNILTNIQCRLFLVLLAQNKFYFPTFKWMFQSMAEMTVKPERLEQRLRQMLTEPPREAAAHLKEVLAETVALVEKMYPQLDTSFVHYALDQAPKEYKIP